MNIIKFRDVVIENDNLFNKTYKGKYAYCINWQRVVPIDIPIIDYIDLSKGNIDLESYNNVLDISKYIDYIDISETQDINNPDLYIYKNNFVTSEDISIDDLKNFRTYLAVLLDNYYNTMSTDDEKLKTMINYYFSNMYDETVLKLSLIVGDVYYTSSVSSQLSNVTYSSCSCASNANTVGTLLNTGCDVISIYRAAIRNIMVKYFSDVEFWANKHDICNEIVIYLNGILNMNLQIAAGTVDGDCANINTSLQYQQQNILKDIIKAFEMIKDGNIVTNKNFIALNLNKFANIYESLKW